MSKIADIAARALDMYIQDLQTEDDFFGQDHFQYMVGRAYAKLLDDEYKSARLVNRQTMGFTYVELSPDWVRRIEITLKEKTEGKSTVFYADLPAKCKPFSFAFDPMANGIQGVYSTCEECDFVKITLADIWKLKHVPPTDKIFYYPLENKIIFRNIINKNVGDGLFVNLIPAIDINDDDFEIPESKELEIINMVLQIMVAAKNGTVIREADDQNKNVILAEQLDPATNPNKK